MRVASSKVAVGYPQLEMGLEMAKTVEKKATKSTKSANGKPSEGEAAAHKDRMKRVMARINNEGTRQVVAKVSGEVLEGLKLITIYDNEDSQQATAGRAITEWVNERAPKIKAAVKAELAKHKKSTMEEEPVDDEEEDATEVADDEDEDGEADEDGEDEAEDEEE